MRVLPRPGQLVAGRYRIERLLGKGGMGAVFLAFCERSQKHLAVKLMVAEARDPIGVRLSDPPLGAVPSEGNTLARFRREAQLAARIKSAHVVHVYDYGVTDDEQPYIAMEYLVGCSLRERLAERGRLSRDETSLVVSHVCRALACAHEAGLVHRDLKPENIFLAREMDEEIVKVLDFGVAKATDALSDSSVHPTRTGALLGTPFYMSPEQAQGLKSVDLRTDLWALGVVVFECLTGKRPFAAGALATLIRQILSAPVPSPSQVSPDAHLSRAIDEFLGRALSRDPGLRFASAREFSEAFTAAAACVGDLERNRADTGVDTAATPPLQQAASAVHANQAPGVATLRTRSPSRSVSPQRFSAPPTTSPIRWIAAVVLLAIAAAGVGLFLVWR
jgi:serine/threonine-protein kinase